MKDENNNEMIRESDEENSRDNTEQYDQIPSVLSQFTFKPATPPIKASLTPKCDKPNVSPEKLLTKVS